MVYPKQQQANTKRLENNYQLMRCAKFYDEAFSWSSFKLKSAAEGIKTRIVFMFWVYYKLCNNDDGLIESRDTLYSTIIAIVAATTEFLILFVARKLISYIFNDLISIQFYVMLSISAFLVCVVSWSIAYTLINFCIKCVEYALSHYHKELDD